MLELQSCMLFTQFLPTLFPVCILFPAYGDHTSEPDIRPSPWLLVLVIAHRPVAVHLGCSRRCSKLNRVIHTHVYTRIVTPVAATHLVFRISQA